MTELVKLWLDRNPIEDITPLSHLTSIDILGLSETLVTDLTPLLENPGLGEGDELDLSDTPLNLSDGSTARVTIEKLKARGVKVLSGSGG